MKMRNVKFVEKSSMTGTQVLRRLLKYIGKYKFYMIFSCVSACVYAFCSLYLPILAGNAIDCITVKGGVDFEKMMAIFLQIAICTLFAGVGQWLMNTLSNIQSYGISKDLRTDVFEKLNKMPLSFLDSHSHGDIISRMVSDVDQVSDGLLLGFTEFFSGIITIVGTLIFMFKINWKIALIVVILTPLSLFIARFIAKKSYKAFKRTSEARGREVAFINEMVENQRVVKAFSMEDSCLEKFDTINNDLGKQSLMAVFFSSITNPTMRFSNNIVYACVCLAGAMAIVSGTFAVGSASFTVGSLTAFLGYANHYSKPFNEISSVITELQNSIACAGRVFELLDEKEETAEKADLKNVELDGNVKIENVNFSYDRTRKLIENFNLDVKKGQKVAIVGPTGCGKTTIINLLMRFYDVDSGTIKYDGNEIRDLRRDFLRSNYGMVLQDSWIKTDTVRENIRLACPDATDDEIIECAKKSYAYSFIKRLPEGLDTVITPEGGTLSVGQRQLICITRIMMTHHRLLILDEATSSIDVRTEMKIQSAFNELMGANDPDENNRRTSFVVAHRLSTIQNADVILVMRDGKVIESGNHEQLLAKNGFYSELYNSQFV